MTTAANQASERVQKVDAAFDAAIGKWTSVGVTLGSLVGISPKDQVLNAIKQMQTLGRDPWANRRAKLAETDAAGWERWVQDGNDMLKNLADIAQDANAASLPTMVIATVQETKQTVQQAAQTVWSAKYIIAAIAIAVAATVWRMR